MSSSFSFSCALKVYWQIKKKNINIKGRILIIGIKNGSYDENDNDVVECQVRGSCGCPFLDLLVNEVVNENMVQILLVDVVDFFGLVVHVRLIITGLSLLMDVKHVNDLV
jgi:hypothetical protein